MDNFFVWLKTIDPVALELQQAVLFFTLGMAILFSGGSLIQDKIYYNPSIIDTVIVGLIQTLFGLLYLLSILFKKHYLCMSFSWIAALIWFGLTGFYFANSLHKIGAITCLILGGTSVLCCFSCSSRRR